MSELEQAARQALEALERIGMRDWVERKEEAITALRKALAQQPSNDEPASLKQLADKHGIKIPDTYIPTMDEAVAAGGGVLMNDQAGLLRECRAALDFLIAQKPTLAGLLCGSTTLGNLRAELGAYRPQGVFGNARPQPATPAIPEGWKPVPVEPTKEMCNAAYAYGGAGGLLDPYYAYKAMLAAAPEKGN